MSRSSLPASILIHHSKGSKSSPSTTTTTTRSCPSLSSSTSTFGYINIDDLPEVLLVEILCRLPSYKFIYQCKCVSQRWCTLLSDPYFIGSFLHHNHSKKQTIIYTLINCYGLEFLTRMSSSTSRPLTPLFRRLMSFHGLKVAPIVLGTYNDLVLCCTLGPRSNPHSDYYICNPYTIQWVPLPPPPPGVYEYSVVGFTFDLPYYNYKKDDPKVMTQLNAENRFKVVRLIFANIDRIFVGKFKVHIFSFETGKWTESIVSSPSGFKRGMLVFLSMCFSYDGMLYWMNEGRPDNFLIGLDPFMINNTNGHCICRLIEFVDCDSFKLKRVGVHGGCLWMWDYNTTTRNLYLWGLKEEELHDKMVMIQGVSKLSLKHTMMRVYSLDENMVPNDINGLDLVVLGFDPNDEDTLYLRIGTCSNIFKYNIRTSEWLKIIEKNQHVFRSFLPFVLPCWPTPVPRLPQH